DIDQPYARPDGRVAEDEVEQRADASARERGRERDLDAELAARGRQRPDAADDVLADPRGKGKVERDLDGLLERDRAGGLRVLRLRTRDIVDGDQSFAHREIISMERVEEDLREKPRAHERHHGPDQGRAP